MPALKTNLSVLKRSRRPPKAGDVVGLHIDGFGWFFGRVIITNAKTSPFPGGWESILLYVFANRAVEPDPPKELTVDNLLIPPIIVSLQAWTSGRLMFLENRPFKRNEKLPVHCFESKIWSPVRYFDESGRELHHRIEPCGIHGLWLARGLDEQISQALGIAPAQAD